MSIQRCVKFLLGFVLFLVVSLCSFTLSFADTPQGYMTITTNTSSGATNSQTTYPLPFYGSAWGATSTTATPNHYVFFSFEQTNTGYFYFKPTDSNITVDASLSKILYKTGGTGTPVITKFTDGFYRIDLNSGTYGIEKVGLSIYLSQVRIAYAFLSNQEIDNSEAILQELQQFHIDVNSSLVDINTALAEILDSLPVNNRDDLKFGLHAVSQTLATRNVTIDYDSAVQLVNFLNTYYIGKSLPFYNSSFVVANHFSPVFFHLSDGKILCTFASATGVLADHRVFMFGNNASYSYELFYDTTTVAVGDLNNSTDDFNNQVQQNDTLEQQFTGSMTSNFNALNLDSFDFNADTLSGMSVVGGIMTSLFNSMGKWGIVYTFPLLLGVVLVVIGRVGRADRKERSGDAKFQEWKDHHFG